MDAKDPVSDIKTGNNVSLDVINLSYTPGKNYVKSGVKFVKSHFPEPCSPLLPNIVDSEDEPELHKINFRAQSGKITAVVGPSHAERSSLIDLLTQSKKSGVYDGRIVVNGIYSNKTTYSEAVGDVPSASLYLPGLTFRETLVYAAKLKMNFEGNSKNKSEIIDVRVKEVLQLMGIYNCRNRLISERPSARGEVGGDMRKLRIAREIITLPPVIILDDPVADLDPGVAVSVFDSLKKLAGKGLVVVCSLSKASPQIFENVDSIVLLSQGYSIYAGPLEHAEAFFCSQTLGYRRKKMVDLIDFLIDIAHGIERPSTQRITHEPASLAEQVENYPHFQKPSLELNCIYANSDEYLECFGYSRSVSLFNLISKTMIITSRAIRTKFREYEVIKKNVGAAIIIACFFGYMEYQQGSFGYYTMSLFGLPYDDCANITGLLLFSSVFMFVQQIINVHIICQKIQVYRYEHSTNACPTLAFAIAQVVSEAPFCAFYALLFAHIVYFLTALNMGIDNYYFFMEVMALTAWTGGLSGMLFSAMFNKEFQVRNVFLVSIFSMLLVSGFPFRFPGMTWYMVHIASVNPVRWVFEALMAWKFGGYKDGSAYLLLYDFDTFRKDSIFEILTNFILTAGFFYMLFLLPRPNYLRQRQSLVDGESTKSGRDDSTHSDLDADTFLLEKKLSLVPTRTSTAPKPLLFNRESSVTARASLSINISQQGDENSDHGPTVSLEDVTYQVKDPKSPVGYNTVLEKVSGQFDWGKLSCIMGASGSGKSSLLHILAGDVGYGSIVSGDILFNHTPIATFSDMEPWQRCAFVECHINHFRDLTVKEIVTFAMKLRITSRKGLTVVEENVTRTLDILDLQSVAKCAMKDLGPGDRRRLSIAEEIVHGPSLLLIDEPTTDLDIRDVSTLLMTFREMVNQDKTVICTVHKPSVDVFKLFDTLMLLCKGRVIYHGKAEQAMHFFIESPFGYKVEGADNPADFLLDVTACTKVAHEGSVITPLALSEYYIGSDLFKRQHANKKKKAAMVEDAESSANFYLPKQESANVSLLKNDVEAMKKPKNSYLYSLTTDYIHSIRHMNYDTHTLKLRTLAHRAFLTLFRRKKLLLHSLVFFVGLALVLGWILSDLHGDAYNTTGFFAIGSMMLMLSNVQLVFFSFNNNQVFLKEHARGLYSNLQHFQTCSIPMYLFRAALACIYCAIVYPIVCLKASTATEGFFFVITILGTLAGTMASEAVIYAVPSPRDCYQIIPFIVFLNFAFSGILIKATTLAEWDGSWMPSASLMRWLVQSQVINEFYNDNDAFPYIELFNYSTYDAFLSIFGWGGKTKYYCLYMILINIAVYRVLTLIAISTISLSQKGVRQFRKPIEGDYQHRRLTL